MGSEPARSGRSNGDHPVDSRRSDRTLDSPQPRVGVGHTRVPHLRRLAAQDDDRRVGAAADRVAEPDACTVHLPRPRLAS